MCLLRALFLFILEKASFGSYARSNKIQSAPNSCFDVYARSFDPEKLTGEVGYLSKRVASSVENPEDVFFCVYCRWICSWVVLEWETEHDETRDDVIPVH